MFFTAGADVAQMVVSGAIASLVLVGLICRTPYRVARRANLLGSHRRPDRLGLPGHADAGGHRAGRARSASGSGSGQQKHVLPAAHTDAVFAVLGEELGLLGAWSCWACSGCSRGAASAWPRERPDRFGSLLAAGITCWITCQALINIAVVTAFMPFTGIPLPFMSFGGSSLITCMAGAGSAAEHLAQRSIPTG